MDNNSPTKAKIIISTCECMGIAFFFLEIVLVTYYLLARGALLTTGNFTLRQRLK